jgi:hypothetical protein
MIKLIFIFIISAQGFSNTTSGTKKKEIKAKKERSAANFDDVESAELAVSALVSFFSCKDTAVQSDFSRCLRLTATEKNQITLQRWISMPYKVQEVRNCDENEASNLAAGFSEQTNIAACFKVSMDNQISNGIAFFQRENGRLKVFSLLNVR